MTPWEIIKYLRGAQNHPHYLFIIFDLMIGHSVFFVVVENNLELHFILENLFYYCAKLMIYYFILLTVKMSECYLFLPPFKINVLILIIIQFEVNNY
jgi:hypothetical protein